MRGEDRLVVDAELRAEAAADIGRDDPNVFGVDVERVGEGLAPVAENLDRHVDGQLVTIPLRHRRMRLHRGGMLARRMELALDPVRGLLVFGLEVTRLGVDFGRAVKLVRLDRLIFMLFRVEDAVFRRDFAPDEGGGMSCLLECLRDDQSDGIAEMANLVGPHHGMRLREAASFCALAERDLLRRGLMRDDDVHAF